MGALPLRVLIVSPDALYRDCLLASLPAQADFTVHAAVASPSDAVQAVPCHASEVLVVDAASPRSVATDLIERAGRFRPRIQVMLVGLPEDEGSRLSTSAAEPDACLPYSAGLSIFERT